MRSFHLECLNGFPGPYVKGARLQTWAATVWRERVSDLPQNTSRASLTLCAALTPHCTSDTDFLDAVGEDGLWDVVRRFENHTASTVCTLGAVDLRRSPAQKLELELDHSQVLLFRGSLSGTVVPPRGDVRHGKKSWNSSFQPHGHSRTFGEMPLAEQAAMSHRHKALAAFAEYMRGHVVTL